MTRVLVLNVGSATLKWRLFRRDGHSADSGATVPWQPDRAAQLRALLAGLPDVDAVGHRVVHGGARFRRPVAVDTQARRALDEVRELDPLHMDPVLMALDAATARYPRALQVAVFDTAFHATLPPPAACYALPLEWTRAWGLHRFGFHGISVESALAQLSRLGPLPRRIVVCHLGSGCSVTAVRDGRSADTSMGFSPLEGMMMGTRAGSVDPGLLLHLQRRHGLSADDLLEALTHDSGLLGLSGTSADFQRVETAAREGDERAVLACERFALDLRRFIGAMAGVLGGVDALVFTGGIGEHSAALRAQGAQALAGMGLVLDEAANRTAEPGADLARPGSAVRAYVLPCREEDVILDHVLRRVGAAGAAT